MIATFPEAIRDNGRYPIGKAAELLQIDRGTLRRHVLSGRIACRLSTRTGRRYFQGAELRRFWHRNF